MPSISMPAALAIGAGVSGVGSLGSAMIGSSAAGDAADAQMQAAQTASDTTMAMYNSNKGLLQPFVDQGGRAQTALNAALPGLTAAGPTWNPTLAGLEATPGFKFSLQQGLQASQNGFAAQGLGSSGAAMKGAAQFAQGLAENTYKDQYQIYQQQFQNYLGQNQQIYNMLNGQQQIGLQGASALAGVGQQATQLSNNYLTSGAAAGAAGTIASAGQWAGALGGIGNSVNSGMQTMALLNSGIFGPVKGSGSVDV